MASLSTGGKISIAEARSGAVIVRGRSPRNFAARKDLPLSSSSTARKHLPSVSRASAGQTSVPQVTSAPKIKSPPDDISQINQVGYDANNDYKQDPSDPSAWMSQMPGDSLAASYSASMNPPPMPTFTHEQTPDLGTPGQAFPFTFPQEMPTNNGGPLSLHFGSDDEGSPYPPNQGSRHSSRPPTSNPSPSLMNKSQQQSQSGSYPGPNAPTGHSPGHLASIAQQGGPSTRPRLHSHQVSMTSVPNSSMNGPHPHPHHQRPELIPMNSSGSIPFAKVEGENAEQLYEYFPLGLDDWMPPVDAVFRPHVVHHSGPLPPDPRSPGGRHTSKRYFSEVV